MTPATQKTWNQWFTEECGRRRVEDDPGHVEELKQPEALPSTPGWFRQRPPRTIRKPGQARSTALTAILARSCSGWPRPPETAEAETAIRTRKPTRRNKAIAETVLCESRLHELIRGEEEQAWSLQDLCWWMHRLSIRRAEVVRLLNALSEEYAGQKKSK